MIYVFLPFAAFLVVARQTVLAICVLALMGAALLGYVDLTALGTPGEWDAFVARPGTIEPTLAPAVALLAVFWIFLTD